MPEVTPELVRALAAVNGLTVSEDRLEAVRREYETFLRLVEEIEQVPLPRGTEPTTGIGEPRPR